MNWLVEKLIIVSIIAATAFVFFAIMGALGAPLWAAFIAWLLIHK